MANESSKFPTLLTASTVVGAIGVGASWLYATPERFWANWIVWFLFLFTLALGCLFIVAIEHMVAARWSVPIRRLPERISTLLLPVIPIGLIALGAVPVL
ncbi:MAG: hypothetical protein Q8O00_15695, partial [Holophaga sp.]|nr:hypothetical protein [Holophaga sp.]